MDGTPSTQPHHSEQGVHPGWGVTEVTLCFSLVAMAYTSEGSGLVPTWSNVTTARVCVKHNKWVGRSVLEFLVLAAERPSQQVRAHGFQYSSRAREYTHVHSSNCKQYLRGDAQTTVDLLICSRGLSICPQTTAIYCARAQFGSKHLETYERTNDETFKNDSE